MSTITVLIALWAICAIVAHGLMYGTAQANWPNYRKRSDRILALILCLFGPAAIVGTVIATLVHGMRFGFRFRA